MLLKLKTEYPFHVSTIALTDIVKINDERISFDIADPSGDVFFIFRCQTSGVGEIMFLTDENKYIPVCRTKQGRLQIIDVSGEFWINPWMEMKVQKLIQRYVNNLNKDTVDGGVLIQIC